MIGLNANKNLKEQIDLDPNNSAAHMFYGLVLIAFRPDKDEALGRIYKAVDLGSAFILPQTGTTAREIITLPVNMILLFNQFNRMTIFYAQSTNNMYPIWSLGLIYLKKHDYTEGQRGCLINSLKGMPLNLMTPQIMQESMPMLLWETK